MNIPNKDILIGTLLGDSSLQTYTRGNTWRLRYVQKDKDYLFHLYEIWKPFVKTPPKCSDDGFGNKRWYFNTIVIPELIDIALDFYAPKSGHNKWIKRVPKNLVITPKSLAYWFMDDGAKKSNGKAYYLCTDSYTLSDVKYLGSIFKENWDIHVSYHKKGTNYRIYIPTKYNEQFKSLISKYMVESMIYKL